MKTRASQTDSGSSTKARYRARARQRHQKWALQCSNTIRDAKRWYDLDAWRRTRHFVLGLQSVDDSSTGLLQLDFCMQEKFEQLLIIGLFDKCPPAGLQTASLTYAVTRLMSKRSKAKEEPSPVAKKPKMANGSHAKTTVGPADHQDIDEDLHSRQLAVYGRGAMRRMAESNILICGLGGIGVETGRSSC